MASSAGCNTPAYIIEVIMSFKPVGMRVPIPVNKAPRSWQDEEQGFV